MCNKKYVHIMWSTQNILKKNEENECTWTCQREIVHDFIDTKPVAPETSLEHYQ